MSKLEQAIDCNDGDQAAKIIQDSKQLSSMPDAGQIERMRAYCVAHPNEKYMAAVHDLFDSLPELPGSAGMAGQMGKIG